MLSSNTKLATGISVVVLICAVAGCNRHEPDVSTTGAASDTAPAANPEQRTDAGITSQINARYFRDSDINGRAVDVTTRNGVVTLTGSGFAARVALAGRDAAPARGAAGRCVGPPVGRHRERSMDHHEDPGAVLRERIASPVERRRHDDQRRHRPPDRHRRK
jgi:hypothetical protein